MSLKAIIDDAIKEKNISQNVKESNDDKNDVSNISANDKESKTTLVNENNKRKLDHSSVNNSQIEETQQQNLNKKAKVDGNSNQIDAKCVNLNDKNIKANDKKEDEAAVVDDSKETSTPFIIDDADLKQTKPLLTNDVLNNNSESGEIEQDLVDLVNEWGKNCNIVGEELSDWRNTLNKLKMRNVQALITRAKSSRWLSTLDQINDDALVSQMESWYTKNEFSKTKNLIISTKEYKALMGKKPRKSVWKWFDGAGQKIRRCKAIGDSDNPEGLKLHTPVLNPKRDKGGHTLQQRCVLCSFVGMRVDVTTLCEVCDIALCNTKKKKCFHAFHDVASLQEYKDRYIAKHGPIKKKVSKKSSKKRKRDSLSLSVLPQALGADPILMPPPPVEVVKPRIRRVPVADGAQKKSNLPFKTTVL